MVLAWWVCDGVWVFRIEIGQQRYFQKVQHFVWQCSLPRRSRSWVLFKNILTFILINHLKTIVFVVYMSIYFTALFFVSTFTASNEYHWSEANSVITACQHMYNTSVFPVCPRPCYCPDIFSLPRGPEFVCSGTAEYFRCLGPSLQRWGVERDTGTALLGDFDGWGWGWGWWCSINSLICS